MAEYQDVLGINAQIRFVGKAGGASLGETWQTGLRIGWSDTVGPFSTDEGRVTLAKKTVKDAVVNRDTTEFQVAQGFAGVGIDAVVTDDDQDKIALAFLNWTAACKQWFASQYTLETIRLYPFYADGTSATAPSIYDPKTTLHDPVATKMMPRDTALCMSLATAVRGPSGRGRMYLGGLASLGLDDDGDASEAIQDPLRAATVELIRDLRFGGGPALAFTPVLHTRGTDTGSVIRAVRTNNLWETQRRRDAQIEPEWRKTNV